MYLNIYQYQSNFRQYGFIVLRQILGAWAVLRRYCYWNGLYYIASQISFSVLQNYIIIGKRKWHACILYSIKSYSKSNLVTVKLFFPLVNESVQGLEHNSHILLGSTVNKLKSRRVI